MIFYREHIIAIGVVLPTRDRHTENTGTGTRRVEGPAQGDYKDRHTHILGT